MKMCQKHWDELRAAIEARGLMQFVSKDGQAAINKAVGELTGSESPSQVFDPLMGAFFSITSNALEMGGLYQMTGDHCPICESEKFGGPPASWWFDHAADEQLGRAKELGLIVPT